MTLGIWVCTDHEGHYPVGVSSVVVADSEEIARQLLVTELKEHGLVQNDPFTMRKLNTETPRAFVLQNGDY